MKNSKEYQPGEYDSLIRNKEPKSINAQGLMPVTHTATPAEYFFKLREAQLEVIDAIFKSKSVSEMKEHIVDELELLRATAELGRLDMREIESAREDTESLKGSYSKGLILDRVDKP